MEWVIYIFTIIVIAIGYFLWAALSLRDTDDFTYLD